MDTVRRTAEQYRVIAEACSHKKEVDPVPRVIDRLHSQCNEIAMEGGGIVEIGAPDASDTEDDKKNRERVLDHFRSIGFEVHHQKETDFVFESYYVKIKPESK